MTDFAHLEGFVVTADGFKFPSADVPSVDVNTLDDYEEGTFTPGLTFGGASVGMTFSGQVGRYTKVGRVVFFQLDVTLSAKGSSTGLAKITGLPVANGSSYGGSAIGFIANLASITGQIMAAVDQLTTTIGLTQVVASGLSNMTDANFTNLSRITVTGHYSV